MPGSREEDFLRNTSILHFLPQNYLRFMWGVMKFIISCLLTLQMLHTKFGYDWPSSFWVEDVNAWRTTHDGRRLTPTHGNRSPEWLRWPKNVTGSQSELLLNFLIRLHRFLFHGFCNISPQNTCTNFFCKWLKVKTVHGSNPQPRDC